MTTTEDQLIQFAVYCSAAVGYAVTGYATKVRNNPDVDFNTGKFAKTLLIGLVAGGIMAARGAENNPEAYAAAAAIAIPIVDKLLNTAIDTADTAV